MRSALLICALVACKHHSAAHDAAGRPAAGASRGAFQLTYYWLPIEDPLAGGATMKIYDRACKPIAKVSAKLAAEMAVSGAGKLADGRMLTVDGECHCPRSPCFRPLADQRWGLGAANRPLVPFRSLAVDRGIIPIGTVLWIAELDGIQLPGDVPTRHDGCVSADDVGGNIRGEQIDWFVGKRPYYVELDGMLRLTEVSVYDGGERCQTSR